MKKSSAAIVRSPLGPRATSVARRASSTAGRSEAGSPWAIEPPIVPAVAHLRVADLAGDVGEHRHLLAQDVGGLDVGVAGERADADARRRSART